MPRAVVLFVRPRVLVFEDDAALRYSLLIVGILAGVLAIGLLVFTLKPYRASLERLQHWNGGENRHSWPKAGVASANSV